MKRTTKLLPTSLAAIAGIALLAGCTQATDASGRSCVLPGSASEGVSVTGEFGSREVEITVDTPVETTETQRSVVDRGSGEAIAPGESVQTVVSVFNGEDAEPISVTSARLTNTADTDDWMSQTLRCAVPGDRVVTVLPAAEVYGVGRVATAGVTGLTEQSSLVMVVDVQARVAGLPGELEPDALLPGATGDSTSLPGGFPELEQAAEGKPSLLIPADSALPDQAAAAPSIVGSGAEVAAGDRVYVRSFAVQWSTGEVVEDEWTEGTNWVTTGVIPGLGDAVIGQTVGSQVVAIVPPTAGYGADGLQQRGYESDEVLVWVIEILGAVPAQTE